MATKEYDSNGTPIVKLDFKVYCFYGLNEGEADNFMEDHNPGPGVFAALGSYNLNEPLNNVEFVKTEEFFYNGYYDFKEENEEAATQILSAGGYMMYAHIDEDEYSWDIVDRTGAGVVLIFNDNNPENYKGPEAIFELKVLDGDKQDRLIESKRYRVFQNEDGVWTSETI